MRKQFVLFSGFIAFFWFLTHAFLVSAYSDEQAACPYVNLYEEPDSPLLTIPTYNQPRAGICYAAAGATVVNYNLILDSRKSHQAWIPISIEDFALQSQRFYSSSLDSGSYFKTIEEHYCKQSETDRALRYFQGVNGGQFTPLEILLVLQDYHSLMWSRLPDLCRGVRGEFPGKRQCALKKDSDRTKFLNEMTSRADLREVYEGYLENNLSIAINFMTSNQASFDRLSFSPANPDDWINRRRVREFMDPRLGNPNFLDTLKIIFRGCEKLRNQVPVSFSRREFLDFLSNIPDFLVPNCIEMRASSGDCQSHVRGSMSRLSRLSMGAFTQASDQIRRAWFQSSPKQPIYLQMYQKVLENKNAVGTEDHAVVLVGQRLKQGRCQWLIRNSAGNACKRGKYDKAWECVWDTRGDEIGVWVDRSAITKQNNASLTFVNR